MPNAAPKHRYQGQRTAEQRRAEVERCRGSNTERGYDQDWRKLRLLYLTEHPFCECTDCDGKLVPAQVVDHRQPISTHPELRLDWRNLRSMTKVCHDRHTATTQGFAQRHRTGVVPCSEK